MKSLSYEYRLHREQKIEFGMPISDPNGKILDIQIDICYSLNTFKFFINHMRYNIGDNTIYYNEYKLDVFPYKKDILIDYQLEILNEILKKEKI